MLCRLLCCASSSLWGRGAERSPPCSFGRRSVRLEEDRVGEHGLIDTWLERLDRGVYFLVAVLFLVAAAAMGVYSVLTFAQHLRDDFPLDLITFINDLLLVLIILEVLGTVRSYLPDGYHVARAIPVHRHHLRHATHPRRCFGSCTP